jgi:hypothetical protein
VPLGFSLLTHQIERQKGLSLGQDPEHLSETENELGIFYVGLGKLYCTVAFQCLVAERKMRPPFVSL